MMIEGPVSSAARALAATDELCVCDLAWIVVLMPVLGWAKLRLGRRLDSGATAGEGVQNLLRAGQALAALIRSPRS